MPWLLFAQPYDEAITGVRSLYFSDVGFVTTPAESPANTYWDRRIEVPLVVEQSLFAGADAGGRSEISVGQITLANEDGALDALAGYDWDGRLIELRFSALANPALADFAVAFSGTAERLVPGDEIAIEVRDLQILLDEPYQPARFAGTGGAEGPAELKDRRKPRVMGVVRQFTPLLLNEPAQVWCFGDGPVGGPLEVRDAGVLLTAGADFASYAALTAATIGAGTYGTCNALGLLRLAVPPSGVLTIDAEGAKPAGTVLKRFADIAVHVVDTATTLAPGDFATGTVAALNALCPQTLGHWYDGSADLTVRGVLDDLAESIGAFYGFDDSRKIVLGRLDAPAATADFAFGELDLIELRPLPAERRLKAQIVRWGRRLRPLQDQDIAGAITGSARQALIEEWRQERDASATVAAASLLAREESLDSAFDLGSDAQAEAQRRIALYGPRRDAFEAVVELVAGLRPGVTVQISDPRFGLAAGRRFRVMRVERRAADREVTMEVWG
jgi:hypothetical protein